MELIRKGYQAIWAAHKRGVAAHARPCSCRPPLHGLDTPRDPSPAARRKSIPRRSLRHRRRDLWDRGDSGLRSVGAAVDYSRANAARTSMQVALDAAALIVAKEAANL